MHPRSVCVDCFRSKIRHLIHASIRLQADVSTVERDVISIRTGYCLALLFLLLTRPTTSRLLFRQCLVGVRRGMCAHPICSVCSFDHHMIECHAHRYLTDSIQYGLVCDFIGSTHIGRIGPIFVVTHYVQHDCYCCCKCFNVESGSVHVAISDVRLSFNTTSRNECVYLFHKNNIPTFFQTNRHVRHNSMLSYAGRKRPSIPPYISSVLTIMWMACDLITNVCGGF